MTRRHVFLLIPLLVAAGVLINCWIIILTTNTLAEWRHYTGLGLFLILIFSYFINFKWAITGAGIYFLLGTCNVLAITAEINTSWFKIGPIETPPVQLLSLGLLVLFAILNVDPLIDMTWTIQKAGKQNRKNRLP